MSNQANGDSSQDEELWHHSNPENTAMWAFLQHVNKKHGKDFKTYSDLYRWSIDNVADFWGEVWDFTGVRASKQYDTVVESSTKMFPRPAFFAGARLNFAENLLYPPSSPSPSSAAIIAATESQRETVTWAQLRTRVLHCQRALQKLGLKKNDIVAGYVGNHANAIVAMLATTSLAGIWTAVSPDSGVGMVLDRLKQVEPTVIFADNAQEYNGKTFGVLGKVRQVVDELKGVKAVVVFEPIQKEGVQNSNVHGEEGKGFTAYDEFVKEARSQGDDEKDLHFEQLDPDQPIYVLYSSGTTGAPKCIVHGAIGTLIQHKKEHVLHCSVEPGDKLFYYTTVTWMMWHWLISGLASGATIIVYDGSPMRYRFPGAKSSESNNLGMPLLLTELKINHFGTSAKYLSILEQNSVLPLSKENSSQIDLKPLKAIYNTASPLAPSTFRFLYRPDAFGKDFNLGSITGGTDIVSLFGAANPLVPVYAGEVQAPGLGMAIRAYNDQGEDITDSGKPGDLVCVKPFPCQPVTFWGKDGQEKYRKAYFDVFDGVWHHGDYVEFNPRTGGLNMLGRSDGVLNPAGIRFGSAEIYNLLVKYFAGKVADGICVGRRQEGESDETVCLFVKMEEGQKFDDDLRKEIKSVVRRELSARHVPPVVEECPDIPVTVNGKKVEKEVKSILSGSKVQTSASVANSECLEFFREWASSN